MKSGLWRIVSRSSLQNAPADYEECPGAKGEAPALLDQLNQQGQALLKSGACTSSSSKGPDGSEASDVTCKVGGVMVATHSVSTEASATHRHEYMETSAGIPGQPAERFWSDNDWTYVGECPAGLLRGQRLLSDGTVLDPWRLARGHLTLNGGAATAGSGDALASEASPPITPVPVAAKTLVGRAHIDCGHSGNGTAWGSLRFDQAGFPFGSATQTWRVRPDLGASSAGEHMLIWDVEGSKGNGDVNGYDREPNYTVRLGQDYAFTPPISQQSNVLGKGGPPLTREAARIRENARTSARAQGRTYCYVGACFPSEAEKAAFVAAFDAAAATGGDLTISRPGPGGIVTVRYPLTGLGGIWARLEKCLR